jgi:LmbE family N-acetylglucosaminyl deacetylase
VFLTAGELGLKRLVAHEARQIREAEARRAAKVLGITALEFLRLPDWHLEEHVAAAASLLSDRLRNWAPATVYVPHASEWHPDHRAAFRIVQEARVGVPELKVLQYEVWTPLQEFDEMADITPVVTAKMRAIRCHRSQLANIRYDRAIRGLNAYRGALATKTPYAEVFRAS